MKDSLSISGDVQSGVPQGSVLGPLLFSLYVADLPSAVSCLTKVRMFADDTKIFREVSDASEFVELQRDLDSIVRWCQTWLLQLNSAKCKCVRYGAFYSGSEKYKIGLDHSRGNRDGRRAPGPRNNF